MPFFNVHEASYLYSYLKSQPKNIYYYHPELLYIETFKYILNLHDFQNMEELMAALKATEDSLKSFDSDLKVLHLPYIYYNPFYSKLRKESKTMKIHMKNVEEMHLPESLTTIPLKKLFKNLLQWLLSPRQSVSTLHHNRI